MIVGKVLKAWVEDNRGHAQIEFDTDDEAERYIRKCLINLERSISWIQHFGYRECAGRGGIF